MTEHPLQSTIEALWERRTEVSSSTGGTARDAVERVLSELDNGALRVAEPSPTGWTVQRMAEEGRAAVVPAQRHRDHARPGGAPVWDKVPMKTEGWGDNRFAEAGFRAVPGAVVRRSAYHRARA